MYLEIGTESAIEGYRDPNGDDPEKVLYRPVPGQRVVRIAFPADMPLQEAFNSALNAIRYHMTETPVFIDSDNTSLENLLEDHFGLKRRAARPKGWGKDTGYGELPKMSDMMATVMAPIYLAGLILALRTNAGRDFQANVMGGGGLAGAGTGAMRPADYIGITTDATAPAAGDTTLTGEVTSGSLVRAQAAYAHTPGTNSYTLTKTFTSDQSIVIAKIGVFNAATAGAMVFETLLNATATLVSGDQLAVTETVTL